VLVAFARPACHGLAGDQLLKAAARLFAAGPRTILAHAGLPAFRGVDANEPHFIGAEMEAVSVNQPRAPRNRPVRHGSWAPRPVLLQPLDSQHRTAPRRRDGQFSVLVFCRP
jgi:hypothetical protein